MAPETYRSSKGELAQLVECCDRTAEVRGSNPLFSINISKPYSILALWMSMLLVIALSGEPYRGN